MPRPLIHASHSAGIDIQGAASYLLLLLTLLYYRQVRFHTYLNATEAIECSETWWIVRICTIDVSNWYAILDLILAPVVAQGLSTFAALAGVINLMWIMLTIRTRMLWDITSNHTLVSNSNTMDTELFWVLSPPPEKLSPPRFCRRGTFC
ncbi:hypothetical protein BDZ89DRAFT_620194 [Hymenopellis radicata]|nr:hypothetical protein BDZ89DRAFT_620194 [Hymenopellis radicata]